MRIVKAVFFLLAVVLLVGIIRKVGVHELLDSFRTLGWRLIIPIIILFPSYLLYAFAWGLFLRKFHPEHEVSFWTLFKVKMAGEAASAATPINFAGGDPMRVWLLAGRLPVAVGGASVIVDRTLQSLAIVSIIFLGNIAAIFQMDLPPYAKKLLFVTAGLLLLLIFSFIFYQTKGVFQKLLKLVERLKIRTFSESTQKKIIEMDRHIGVFYRHHRGVFLAGYGLHFAARLIGVLEIYFISLFLGVPMGIWGAIFFSAVIPVTNILGALVPGTLGVLEGVVSSLFYALHWNPADGIALQMARRLRALFWIIIGFIFIWVMRASEKRRKKTLHKQ